MILRFKRDISQGQAMGTQIGEREFWGGIARMCCRGDTPVSTKTLQMKILETLRL